MITNLIINLAAAISISVVTNWTDVHAPASGQNNIMPCYSVYPANRPAICTIDEFQWNGWQFEAPKGEYLGKDGLVVRITEIRFDYDGKPQVHRIEERLEKIILRCHKKEPELIWDEPKREKLGDTNVNYLTY